MLITNRAILNEAASINESISGYLDAIKRHVGFRTDQLNASKRALESAISAAKRAMECEQIDELKDFTMRASEKLNDAVGHKDDANITDREIHRLENELRNLKGELPTDYETGEEIANWNPKAETFDQLLGRP